MGCRGGGGAPAGVGVAQIVLPGVPAAVLPQVARTSSSAAVQAMVNNTPSVSQDIRRNYFLFLSHNIRRALSMHTYIDAVV